MTETPGDHCPLPVDPMALLAAYELRGCVGRSWQWNSHGSGVHHLLGIWGKKLLNSGRRVYRILRRVLSISAVPAQPQPRQPSQYYHDTLGHRMERHPTEDVDP